MKSKQDYIDAGIGAEISIQPDGKYMLSDNYGGYIGEFSTLEEAKCAVPAYLELDPVIKNFKE